MFKKEETYINDLVREVNRLKKALSTLSPESDKYAQVHKHYLAMHSQLNDYMKTLIEEYTKRESLWVNAVVTLTTMSVPLIFKSFWIKAGLLFEETGSFCSQTLKWIIDSYRTKG